MHGFTGHPEQTWTHKKGDVAAAPCDSGEPPSKKQRLAPFSRSSRTSGDKYAPVYWPRDLLPDALPNARILTYGYDTHLRHHFQGPGPKSTVYDMAWNFLLQLGAERDAHSSRPLLFVAHSLGGILVKEALRRSERCQSNLARLRDVFTFFLEPLMEEPTLGEPCINSWSEPFEGLAFLSTITLLTPC